MLFFLTAVALLMWHQLLLPSECVLLTPMEAMLTNATSCLLFSGD